MLDSRSVGINTFVLIPFWITWTSLPDKRADSLTCSASQFETVVTVIEGTARYSLLFLLNNSEDRSKNRLYGYARF